MTTLIYIITLFCNYSSFSEGANFEGLIIYERLSSSGDIALEKYYFADQKIRIDSEFLVDSSIVKYTTVYLFDNYENFYFSKSGDSKFVKKRITKDAINRYTLQNDSTNILDQLCKKATVEYEMDSYFNSTISQKRWVAVDLKFALPTGWIMDYSMICHKDNRIVLRLEESITPPDELKDFVKTSGYIRKAIGIYPFKFDDSLFSVKNR